jgi:hypothetical protein
MTEISQLESAWKEIDALRITVKRLEARIREMQSVMRQHAHALDVEAANFDVALLDSE